MSVSAPPLSPLTLSESAARRVRFLQQKRGNDALMLRVTVDSGGCSGFQYKMEFVDSPQDGDTIFTMHGVQLVTDDISLEYLGGSEVDYVEALIGASFQVKNPQAASSCGCGTSFSVA